MDVGVVCVLIQYFLDSLTESVGCLHQSAGELRRTAGGSKSDNLLRRSRWLHTGTEQAALNPDSRFMLKKSNGIHIQVCDC